MTVFSTLSSEDLISDENSLVIDSNGIFQATASRWQNFMNKYSTLADDNYVSVREIEEFVENCIAPTNAEFEEESDNSHPKLNHKTSREKSDKNEPTITNQSSPGLNESTSTVNLHLGQTKNDRPKRRSKRRSSCMKGCTESNRNFQTYDQWVKTASPQKSLFNKLDEYIKYYLRIHIDFYFVQLWSSLIKNDREDSFWRNLLFQKTELLLKYLDEDKILFFLEKKLHRNNTPDQIVEIIEGKLKSNLKHCFEMRKKGTKPEDECRLLIKYEWKLLSEHIPEHIICFYHSILYGPTSLM